MHFRLIDVVVERDADRLVAVKQVSLAEEYLQDHFPTFPVLPGVLMIEAMVQAGRELLAGGGGRDARLGRHVLGSVKALKFGSFVRPGESLRVEVKVVREEEGSVFAMQGSGVVVRPDGSDPAPCVSGKFTLRPVRLAGL